MTSISGARRVNDATDEYIATSFSPVLFETLTGNLMSVAEAEFALMQAIMQAQFGMIEAMMRAGTTGAPLHLPARGVPPSGQGTKRASA